MSMIGDAGSEIASPLDLEQSQQTERAHRVQAAIAKLAAFTVSPTITRAEAILIMDGVENLLGALLDQRQAASAADGDSSVAGLEFELIHPATDAVRQIAAALSEMKHGVVHPIFKPPPGLSMGNVTTANEQELAKVAVTLVRALCQNRKLTVDQACSDVAKALADERVCFQGKYIKSKTLKGWLKGRRPGASR